MLFDCPQVPKLLVVGQGCNSGRPACVIATRHPSARLHGSVFPSVRSQATLLAWTVLTDNEFIYDSSEWEHETTCDAGVAWLLNWCIERKRPVFELSSAVLSSRPANQYVLSKDILEKVIKKKGGGGTQWRAAVETQLWKWFTALPSAAPHGGDGESTQSATADSRSLQTCLFRDLESEGANHKGTRPPRKKQPRSSVR